MNFNFCQQKRKYEEPFILHDQFVFVAWGNYKLNVFCFIAVRLPTLENLGILELYYFLLENMDFLTF